jgi:hypothetical protein
VCGEDQWMALGRENRQGRFDDVVLLGVPYRSAVSVAQSGNESCLITSSTTTTTSTDDQSFGYSK